MDLDDVSCDGTITEEMISHDAGPQNIRQGRPLVPAFAFADVNMVNKANANFEFWQNTTAAYLL